MGPGLSPAVSPRGRGLSPAKVSRGFLNRLARVPVEIDIDHVARLARLRLSAEEKERLRIQLGLILEHAERVQEVAAEDVPPTSYAVPRSNVFRPDEPVPCLGHEEAMAGAPEREDDRFRVPRVVELEDDGERP